MAVMIEGDRNEINYYKDKRDAERWRKLLALVGTPQDGSDTVVLLSWDDATMTPSIKVGKQEHFAERGSFERVIDGIEWPSR